VKVITLSIPVTEEACVGESGVITQDDRSTSLTRNFELDVQHDVRFENAVKSARAFWTVSCVCLTSDPSGECPPEAKARVLVFSLRDIGQYPHPGFTVTSTQGNKPEILQFSLSPDDEALFDSSESERWHNPTVMSVPNGNLGSKLYHSSVFDNSILNPTLSGYDVPIPTELASTISMSMTISEKPPTATRGHEIGAIYHLGVPSSPLATATPTAVVEFQVIEPSTRPEQVIKVAKANNNRFWQAVMGSKPMKLTSTPFSPISMPKDMPEGDGDIGHDELSSGGDILPTPSTTAHSPTLSGELGPPMVVEAPGSLETRSSTDSEISGLSTYRHDQVIRALLLTSLIIAIASLLTAIFVVLFRNPRRRADCAARHEERQRRRLYRRAARQHKWRTWYRRIRGKLPSLAATEPVAQTWEEKQVQVLRTDDSSLRQMRRELRALRAAHTVVDGIIRAEEGRTNGEPSVSRVVGSQSRVRSFSTSTTASAGLPSYEESLTVSGGYHYTPEATDNTPDSSVIDTSPRTSIYMRDSDSEKE
jgi:hypothetical protein